MINLAELQKVVTSGKVVTLVVMIDGKELAAISFTVDTVAFKEILDTVVKGPVTIADKAKDVISDAQKSFDKKADKALGKKKTEPVKEKIDKETGADTDTGEIKEDLTINKNESAGPGTTQPKVKLIVTAAAATLEEEPEVKPEIKSEVIIETDVKNEKVPEDTAKGNSEINFSEEAW